MSRRLYLAANALAAANRAIERALREGSATSASLMVPCPWAKPAAKISRDLDIGVLTPTKSLQKKFINRLEGKTTNPVRSAGAITQPEVTSTSQS